MPEWLVERGIGETRAVLAENQRIVAAIVEWPELLTPGQRCSVWLAQKPAGSVRGRGILDNGQEVMLDRLPREISEGSTLEVEIVREAIAEAGRFKLPLARPASGREAGLAGRLGARVLPAGDTATLAALGWDDLWQEAFDGRVAFAGGDASIHPTPAMTVIDIDGVRPARELALAAGEAVGRAVPRLALGGNVGIDFPTLESKEDRRAVDRALASALGSWPCEMTAMNGFGFVQIVSRLERPSLVARFAFDRAGALARWLLRQAEALTGAGAIELACGPGVRGRIEDAWVDELARRTGRDIRWRDISGLAALQAHAQLIPR